MSTSEPRPVVLSANQFPHFYRGGRRIEAFRGLAAGAGNTPEDWVASTTTRFGQAEQGLSRLPGGGLLRDAVAANPLSWLGPEHVAAFGPELELLIKLLDAGQRLVVHAHPDRAFAARHLGCRHGKTEAWVVVEAEPGAVVYLGFREDQSEAGVRRWVDTQDVAAMLGALNELPVAAGDAILVPAGVPHAIGAGVLIVELQEPTDFSVLLEWDGFDLDGPAHGHLGLGFDVALGALDRSAWSPARLGTLRGPTGEGAVLPAAAEAFFRAQHLRGGAECDTSVAVLVVTDGAGALRGGFDTVALRRGDTVLVPYAAGATRLDGAVTVLRCRPPDPQRALP